VGDYRTTGFYSSFTEDRFAMEGDQILAPMVAFLKELLLQPLLENGVFCKDYVESEKKNLISTIESELNDKRTYSMNRLLRILCREDTFGVPRLGEADQVERITPQSLYEHYQKILKTSPIEIFYVGSAEGKTVADALMPLLKKLPREPVALLPQTPFHPCEKQDVVETMDVSQGKLCMGFVTPITNRCADFAAMQILNVIYGSGMTSKLFVNVREKMSLCYSIGSGYYGTKGILVVSAGIDFDKEQLTRQEALRQLQLCKDGSITEQELRSAKEALLSSLRGTHDSPGAIEGYYSTAALSGLIFSHSEYMTAVEETTLDQVVVCANSLELHTTYFLKGGSQ
jgi:predicted Zn-dependent peptidase